MFPASQTVLRYFLVASEVLPTVRIACEKIKLAALSWLCIHRRPNKYTSAGSVSPEKC